MLEIGSAHAVGGAHVATIHVRMRLDVMVERTASWSESCE